MSTPVGAASNPGSGAIGDSLSKAAGGSSMNKDSFLLLLVTQFKYQDPLNPMEDKEFIAQLAQFTALEQQMSTNEQMTKLVDLQTEQKMLGAVSYIGKEVSARGDQVSVTNGVPTLIEYSVAEEMASGRVTILDSNGGLIKSIELPAGAAGIHQFDKEHNGWDGTNLSGAKVPDGVYRVYITAEDSKGEPLLTDTSISGKVVGVTKYNGDQLLRLADGRTVSMSNVRQIVESSIVNGGDKDDPDKGDDDKDPDTPEVTPHNGSTPDAKPGKPENGSGAGDTATDTDTEPKAA